MHRHVHHNARRQVRDVQAPVSNHGAARGHVHYDHLDQCHVHDVAFAARAHGHVNFERTVTSHVVHDHVSQTGVRYVHELPGGHAVVYHDRLQAAGLRGRARQIDRTYYLRKTIQINILINNYRRPLPLGLKTRNNGIPL